jgi:hypothetical protein
MSAPAAYAALDELWHVFFLCGGLRELQDALRTMVSGQPAGALAALAEAVRVVDNLSSHKGAGAGTTQERSSAPDIRPSCHPSAGSAILSLVNGVLAMQVDSLGSAAGGGAERSPLVSALELEAALTLGGPRCACDAESPAAEAGSPTPLDWVAYVSGLCTTAAAGTAEKRYIYGCRPFWPKSSAQRQPSSVTKYRNSGPAEARLALALLVILSLAHHASTTD